MSKEYGNTVICTYRVKGGKEREFLQLLHRHLSTLKEHDLVTAEPTQLYQGEDEPGAPFFVEIFSWKSAEAVRIAHQLPAVLALWEPMEKLCEERKGRPAMEFPHVRPIRREALDAAG